MGSPPAVFTLTTVCKDLFRVLPEVVIAFLTSLQQRRVFGVLTLDSEAWCFYLLRVNKSDVFLLGDSFDKLMVTMGESRMG